MHIYDTFLYGHIGSYMKTAIFLYENRHSHIWPYRFYITDMYMFPICPTYRKHIFFTYMFHIGLFRMGTVSSIDFFIVQR